VLNVSGLGEEKGGDGPIEFYDPALVACHGQSEMSSLYNQARRKRIKEVFK
jgi:hypothetical protein